MPPAHERLRARKASALEIDDRLVVELKLLDARQSHRDEGTQASEKFVTSTCDNSVRLNAVAHVQRTGEALRGGAGHSHLSAGRDRTGAFAVAVPTSWR